MRHHCLIIVLSLIFLSITALAGARSGAVVGGWTPIENIKDPHVTEIADYAVTEYDKRSGSKLKLVKVIEGQTQVVAGTNYRLLLAANAGSNSKTNNYEALVWEKPWQHFRNLTSFKPVH